jgi:L-ribulose-5-phosphate 4-epimerase
MNYIDEGYIKFSCEWKKTNSAVACSQQLLAARDKMHDLKFIGFDEHHQVGYGNISERAQGNQFIISGTQTGHIYPINPLDFTLITAFDIDANKVHCEGPAQASSETMTHAALYKALPETNTIIHIHSKVIWRKLLETDLKTAEEVPYGTPEMAYEIKRLLAQENVIEQRILAMAGHEDGVITFGKTFEEAMKPILLLID